MGILTDPSLSQKNPMGKKFIKHARKISFLFYTAGVIWFVCLANLDFNFQTYMSENALSPGLVYSEIKQDSAHYVESLLRELSHERINHKSNIPYSWLLAKMKQIGLETYVHNFTLNFPFGGGKVFHGKNVYGILRTPRSSSTEGIVFSTPYRPPNSVYTDISASIPVLLAFAELASKKNYWAKDLIFLITDQEQLGMQAWLEAYYNGGRYNGDSVLNAGSLSARSGALQAALNIEIQDLDCQYLDVKVEGLNGQLPNLDMFNLVQRIAIRESLLSGYKQFPKKKRSASQQTMKENLKHMLSMILSQANGVPTGNHGLFHQYRVESLTLECIKRHSKSSNIIQSCLSLLKTIEGISRSLNNLLERFHQSFFFYILVANDRFVSIGDFIPCIILMASSLYIKAFLIWLSINNENENEGTSQTKIHNEFGIPFTAVGKIFGVSILFGFLAYYLPLNKQINDVFASYNISTNLTLLFLLMGVSVLALVVPFFVKLTKTGIELLHVVHLLYIGSVLMVIGLLNFSLGFLLSLGIVPLAIFINVNHRYYFRFLTIMYTILIQPLIFVYLIIFIATFASFPELDFGDLARKAFEATSDAIAITVTDSLIYKNWLFMISSIILFPAWILFWISAIISEDSSIQINKNKKTN